VSLSGRDGPEANGAEFFPVGVGNIDNIADAFVFELGWDVSRVEAMTFRQILRWADRAVEWRKRRKGK
jgi:hypothetical protein